MSGKTKQLYHGFLHLIFNQAIKHRIITANPCQQVDRPRANPYIAEYYNTAEIKKLLDCIYDAPLRIPIILGVYYGLRRSEVLGLKWSARDWADDKIIIRHKIVENILDNGKIIGLNVMKTKSSYRTLSLIPYIKDVLLKENQEAMQKMLRGSYNKQYIEYICVDAMGNIITPEYLTRHFNVVLRKNKLKHIRFHDLRHSCASMLLANKVPMKMIQEWLGHSDMGTTANIYSHLDFASKKESAAVIGNALISN